MRSRAAEPETLKGASVRGESETRSLCFTRLACGGEGERKSERGTSSEAPLYILDRRAKLASELSRRA